MMHVTRPQALTTVLYVQHSLLCNGDDGMAVQEMNLRQLVESRHETGAW